MDNVGICGGLTSNFSIAISNQSHKFVLSKFLFVAISLINLH